MALQDHLPIATPEGYFVSREHQRIAEIIQDYDPDLYLVFIPPADRNHDDPTEKPWAVVHMPGGKAPYFVFYADECDERILERLWRNDQNVNNPLSELEAKEAAQQAIKYKKEMEQLEMQADIAKSMIRSPLHTYRINGKKLSL